MNKSNNINYNLNKLIQKNNRSVINFNNKLYYYQNKMKNGK